MRRVAALVVVASCAAPLSNVIVEPDPLTGEPTAYATIFLDEHAASRVVLSGQLGSRGPAQLTLWTPAATGDCALTLRVGDHIVKPGKPSARIVETPSGADQTFTFTLPPAVLKDASLRPTALEGCGGPWPLDDDDRGVLREFLQAMESRR